MKHLLFSTLFACLFLGAIELVLRAIYPERLRNINYHGEVAYEFDEDYLMRLKKKMVKHYYRAPRNGGKEVIWKTNSQGFRGAEIRPGAKPRIVVYGDSNIQARFSEEEDTYTQKLQHYLSANFPEVEVINAGVIGFGPDQALLKFEKEVDFLKPDVAIFNIFCDNDFGDLIRNRLFEIREDGQLALTSFEREPDRYLQHYRSQKRNFQLLIADAGRTFLNRLFGEKEDPLKKEKMLQALQDLCREEFDIYRQSKPQSVSHFMDHYDLDLAIDPAGEAAQIKIALMTGVLRKIRKAGLAHGVRIIIQIQPSAIDLTRRHIISHDDLQVNLPYDRRRLTDTGQKICMENQLEYLNLFDVFSARKPDECYFLHDDHWNDRGQEVAAEAMAERIEWGMEN